MISQEISNFRGDGPVWIRLTEDKICSGTEQSLSECKERNLWIHDHRCAHAEDVAVTCESNAPDTYTEEITDYLDIDGLRTGFEEPDETTQSPEFEMISNEATISLAGPTEDCGRTRYAHNRLNNR